MYFSLAEKLYPGSGYFYEAGGYLQNLRNSTSIEKVRDYHKMFYRYVKTQSIELYINLNPNIVWVLTLDFDTISWNICKTHSSFLFICCRTENLVLTITGRMNEEDLFETLRKTEEKVLRKRQHEGCEEFTRPWQTPLQKLNLTEDYIYEIEYPSEDESLGKISDLIWIILVSFLIDICSRKHRNCLEVKWNN